MTSISIIMATARDNYPIIGQPKLHMLKPTIDSLKAQSFKEFEFIIVDALYNKRPKLFQGDPFNSNKLPFRVKHIPIHKDHRYWIDRKRWNVCGQLNTALMYCQGELIVRIDDCCEFDSEFIKRFWDGYKCGVFPGAMHIRFMNGKPARLNGEHSKIGYDTKLPVDGSIDKDSRDELLHRIYGESGLIRDIRYDIVNKNGGRMIGTHNWHHGYSSIPLKIALKLNGYDENLDADKGLEDIDYGSRIEMAGYKDKFMMDVHHQVIEHENGSLAKEVFNTEAKPIKCNYTIYLLNRIKKRYRANTGKMSGDDIDFIRQESLRVPCISEGIDKTHFYDGDCQGSMFETWMFRQPVFDLSEERKNIIDNMR
jgi:glycosyltransferase involved in cell wall biosynthesis